MLLLVRLFLNDVYSNIVYFFYWNIVYLELICSYVIFLDVFHCQMAKRKCNNKQSRFIVENSQFLVSVWLTDRQQRYWRLWTTTQQSTSKTARSEPLAAHCSAARKRAVAGMAHDSMLPPPRTPPPRAVVWCAIQLTTIEEYTLPPCASTDSSATLRENPTNFPQPQVQLGSE